MPEAVSPSLAEEARAGIGKIPHLGEDHELLSRGEPDGPFDLRLDHGGKPTQRGRGMEEDLTSLVLPGYFRWYAWRHWMRLRHAHLVLGRVFLSVYDSMSLALRR